MGAIKRLNILIADHFGGVTKKGGWRNLGFFHEKYFAAMGHDVTVVPLENSPHWTDFRGNLPFYLPKGLPLTLNSIERKIGKKFDVYFEIDANGQHHLLGADGTKPFKMLWSCDIQRKDKQKFHLWFEKEFDAVLVAQKNFMHLFKERPCHWLPYACDPEIHRKIDAPEIYDIVFIGNTNPAIYPERVRLLECLGKHLHVNVFNNVYGEQVPMIYSQSKIVFNKSSDGELNLRVFDVLCSGAFLLTDKIGNGLPDIFEDKKHLVMYDNAADLKEKAAYYLSHDSERKKIAMAGWNEVRAKHTFYHRAQAIMKIVETESKK